MKEEKDIQLKDLILDLQPRFELDGTHVSDLQNKLRDMVEEESGWGFDPLLVAEYEDGTLHLIAGYHRHRAARNIGLNTVPCIIERLTENQAKIAALKSNTSHGLKMKPAELSVRIKEILQMPEMADKSGREVANLLGVSHTHVNNIRRKMGLTPSKEPIDPSFVTFLRLMDKYYTPLQKADIVPLSRIAKRANATISEVKKYIQEQSLSPDNFCGVTGKWGSSQKQADEIVKGLQERGSK